MKVQIIQVPYDSSHRGVRMGKGPEYLVDNKIIEYLRSRGSSVYTDIIEVKDSFQSEIKTSFELNQLLSEKVSKAKEKGRFPLVLSGNCNSALGTIAGVNERIGVIWLDGHSDFETPETTETGFLDGMGLAMISGICWSKMVKQIPHFNPVPGKYILHIGGRLSEKEQFLLHGNDVTTIPAELFKNNNMKALQVAIKNLSAETSKVYVHLDVDVLDPEITPSNEFAEPNGLTVKNVRDIIEMISENFIICASGIASFDPDYANEKSLADVQFFANHIIEKLGYSSR